MSDECVPVGLGATQQTITSEMDAAILAQARRMARGDVALADDLAQEGRIGTWQALQRYDADRGVPVLPYALYWSRLRMITALRGTFAQVTVDLDDPDTPELGDEGAAAVRIDAQIWARELLAGLRRDDHTIVVSILQEAPGRELARSLGCSERYARILRQRVLSRLRVQLSQEVA